MLVITHAAIGGALGESIANPWAAFGVGMISHLIIDKIPHFWNPGAKIKRIVLWADGIATALFLIFLYFVPSHNHPGLIFGALGGVVIDLTLVVIFKEKGRLAEWHTKRQTHHEGYWWLLPDVTLFAIGLAAIILAR